MVFTSTAQCAMIVQLQYKWCQAGGTSIVYLHSRFCWPICALQSQLNKDTCNSAWYQHFQSPLLINTALKPWAAIFRSAGQKGSDNMGCQDRLLRSQSRNAVPELKPNAAISCVIQWQNTMYYIQTSIGSVNSFHRRVIAWIWSARLPSRISVLLVLARACRWGSHTQTRIW